MTCAAFGSTSEVAVFMAVDPDPSAAIPTAQKWAQVRMTGESLDQNLSSSVSEEITPERSYSDSKLSDGQIVGGFNFEASYALLGDLLLPILQVDKDMGLGLSPAPGDPWATTEEVQNGSTKHCLMFMKRVKLADNNYWYYTYRGCQLDTLSLNMEVGSLVNGSITLLGSGGSVFNHTAATGPSGSTWTYVTPYSASQLMSAVDSIKNFALTDHSDTPIVATFQSLSLSFSNSLRAQNSISSDSIYPAGVASGRFMAELSSSIYFQNGTIYTQLINDNVVKLAFDLEDSAGNKFSFDFDKLKPQGGTTPLAPAPDQDLVSSPAFRAFEDATQGTVSISRTDA